MDYLIKYNLSPVQIQDLRQILSEQDIANYELCEAEIKKILDYFLEIGITNIAQIIEGKPDLFYNTKEEIQEVIENNEYQNIIFLLNEDLANFELLGC